MLLFFAGMPRSGSTFSFNVGRKLLLSRGSVHQEAGTDFVEAISRSCGSDNVILKAHTIDPFALDLARHGAVKIVCTTRPLREAIASYIDVFHASEQQTLDVFRGWLHAYRDFRKFSLVVPYCLVEREPRDACSRIGKYILPEASEAELEEIAQYLDKASIKVKFDALSPSGHGIVDVGFSHYDSETFFHRRHVSDLQARRPEDRASGDSLMRIVAQLRSLVDEVGLTC